MKDNGRLFTVPPRCIEAVVSRALETLLLGCLIGSFDGEVFALLVVLVVFPSFSAPVMVRVVLGGGGPIDVVVVFEEALERILETLASEVVRSAGFRKERVRVGNDVGVDDIAKNDSASDIGFVYGRLHTD